MPIIPRIIPPVAPSCKALTSESHMRCAIRGLYDLVNANYDFLLNGGLTDAILEALGTTEGIKEIVERIINQYLDIDGTEATTDDIDSLFP